MALSSPRADSLESIRDLVILIAKGTITDHSSFDAFLIRAKQWKKSRRYHYLSALRDLRLIEMDKGQFKLGNIGNALVQIGGNNFGGLDDSQARLNEGEKEFFRQHLLSYSSFAQFLSLFLEPAEACNNYSVFSTKSKAIGFEFDKTEYNRLVEDSDAGSVHLSGWRVLTPQGLIKSLSKTEQPALMWTLKYWAKSLDLVDELWIPEFREYKGRFQKALFPIKEKDAISLDDFQERLDNLIARQRYSSNYIPIPILMHDFCTSNYIKVKAFLGLLCTLHITYPGDYYLDRVSRAYINERLHSIGRTAAHQQNRESQVIYTNYPKIDGFYCSHLVIRKARATP